MVLYLFEFTEYEQGQLCGAVVAADTLAEAQEILVDEHEPVLPAPIEEADYTVLADECLIEMPQIIITDICF